MADIEFFKKNVWTLAFIAAILVIISIFTPIVISGEGPLWGIRFLYEVGIDIGFFIIGVSLIISISFSGALLLYYSILTWRGTKFKRAWAIYLLIGIVLILLSILFWVDVDYVKNHIQPGIIIGFTSIGSFIAGVLSIVTGVFEQRNVIKEEIEKVDPSK